MSVPEFTYLENLMIMFSLVGGFMFALSLGALVFDLWDRWRK